MALPASLDEDLRRISGEAQTDMRESLEEEQDFSAFRTPGGVDGFLCSKSKRWASAVYRDHKNDHASPLLRPALESESVDQLQLRDVPELDSDYEAHINFEPSTWL